MRVLNSKEVFQFNKDGNLTSLYTFAKDTNNDLLSQEQKKEISNWINKINNLHHNDAKFFENFKSLFSINGVSQVLEGQEDIAGIEHKNIIFIIRQAEMGVAFGFKSLNENANIIEINTLEEIINGLDVGFGNAKNFQSKILFDKMNIEVQTKENQKNKTVKL